ncbi:MAG TPA: hypothetical protein VMF59_02655, partial [Bacteroidota bacterium]|nr:hypothetical protein [Bacteroidota bacterium]
MVRHTTGFPSSRASTLLLLASVFLVVFARQIPAQTRGGKRPASPRESTTDYSYRPFLINNIFAYYGNIGDDN